MPTGARPGNVNHAPKGVAQARFRDRVNTQSLSYAY